MAGCCALALVGATIHPSPDEATNGVVLVEGATIAAVGSSVQVPSGAAVLDCSGQTITAGRIVYRA